MASKDDNENENENEDDDDDETMSQNEKDMIIKQLNDALGEIIDQLKSLENQIKLFKKIEGLEEYWYSKDYGDKKLKSKYFKIKLPYMLNEIDKKLFEQIFSHTLEKLVNKLINTKTKEENQIIVKNINKNKEKHEEYDDERHKFVIQPNSQRVDLTDAINLILDFNETI